MSCVLWELEMAREMMGAVLLERPSRLRGRMYGRVVRCLEVVSRCKVFEYGGVVQADIRSSSRTR